MCSVSQTNTNSPIDLLKKGTNINHKISNSLALYILGHTIEEAIYLVKDAKEFTL
jgi:hypothetical protein